MLAERFGALIRQARREKGLTQVALADAAKVSRTVVSRLEQGKPRPVQTDVLDRVLAVLDVVPQLAGDDRLAARRLARMEQGARLERQRSRHLRLALDLAGDRRSRLGLPPRPTRNSILLGNMGRLLRLALPARSR